MADTDRVFPGDEEDYARVRRQALFNDDVHMNDRGQAAVARFLAGIIRVGRREDRSQGHPLDGSRVVPGRAEVERRARRACRPFVWERSGE